MTNKCLSLVIHGGAGAMAGRSVASSTYIPIYRTPAGTGMGMGFVRWT